MIINVTRSLIRFKAFQNITTLLKEVSLRSDINGEYFYLNSLRFYSLMFLDSLISLITIATTDPIAAVRKTIER